MVFYQDAVAFAMGLRSVPIMDYTCFLGGSKAIVNFMNCTWYATDVDYELVKAKVL